MASDLLTAAADHPGPAAGPDPSASAPAAAPETPGPPSGERTPWLRRTWTALGAPASGRRIPGTATIAVVAAAVGLLACLYTTGQGSNLDYSDAQSHLTIARRVFDSKAPGFEQLGTVWLPMPHLLLMPFIINLWMFSTGWGACLLGTIALAATALGALVLFPLTARRFAGPIGRPLGRALLVVVRSTPEYMLAYVALQLLGPSMLPAILALALHNAGIVAYLMGRHADAIPYRADAPRGLDLYAYETVPRLYGQFLAYLLYRWELILRESAIFGILGVTTLGFYVDAAISELRLDVALVLIAATALVTMAVDAFSRALRRSLRIDTLPTRLSGRSRSPGRRLRTADRSAAVAASGAKQSSSATPADVALPWIASLHSR